jgi:hypothetical protein
MVGRIVTAGCFAGGLSAGIRVTRTLHQDPDSGRWGQRIASTRLRYADLPVGGTIALAVSVVAPEPISRAVRALGLGASAGALGFGCFDPLPPSA